MFDVAPTEFLLVAVVALIVIGPKDLPKAMRVLGYWVGRMRGVARQFRAGFDNMVREAELEEMEKRWAAENARIMAEHPFAGEPAASVPAVASVAPPGDKAGDDGDLSTTPVFVERPEIRPAGDAAPPAATSWDGAPIADDPSAPRNPVNS